MQKFNHDITFIGNAIVDVICRVNEEFIYQNNLIKGNMKLIFDEKEFMVFLTKRGKKKTIEGQFPFYFLTRVQFWY